MRSASVFMALRPTRSPRIVKPGARLTVPHTCRSLRAFPSMKALLAALTLGSLTAAGLADIRVPPPNSFTLTNLAAFSAYKFSYSQEDTDKPKRPQPLADGKAYSYMSWGSGVRLFVASANGAAQQWVTLSGRNEERDISIAITAVKREGDKISVEYKKSKATGKESKPSILFPTTPTSQFLIAALGFGGLVLLARRRSQAEPARA